MQYICTSGHKTFAQYRITNNINAYNSCKLQHYVFVMLYIGSCKSWVKRLWFKHQSKHLFQRNILSTQTHGTQHQTNLDSAGKGKQRRNFNTTSCAAVHSNRRRKKKAHILLSRQAAFSQNSPKAFLLFLKNTVHRQAISSTGLFLLDSL